MKRPDLLGGKAEKTSEKLRKRPQKGFGKTSKKTSKKGEKSEDFVSISLFIIVSLRAY